MLYEIFAMQFIFSFMYCLWNIIAIDRLLSADTGPERASSVAGRAFPLTNGLFFNRPIFLHSPLVGRCSPKFYPRKPLRISGSGTFTDWLHFLVPRPVCHHT